MPVGIATPGSKKSIEIMSASAVLKGKKGRDSYESDDGYGKGKKGKKGNASRAM